MSMKRVKSVKEPTKKWGETIANSNVKIGDIIKYKSGGEMRISVVKGIAHTCIRVDDLRIDVTIDGVNLFINPEKNLITKKSLGLGRRMEFIYKS